MKTILKIVLIWLLSLSSYAQQDAQYTQYMYNTVVINPAYAGSRGALSALLLYRAQWVGFTGAPVTSTFSIHSPIKNSNLGLGLTVVNDRIGPSNENNIAVDFSYTIHTSERFKLSFGLKASANLLNIDFDKLSLYNPNDFLFENNIDNKFSPNIGVGVYWHSDDFYMGLSAPNLLETKHFDKYSSRANSHVAKEKIHTNFIIGQIFDLSTEIKFKPSVLVKMIQGAPLQVNLSTNFMFNNNFTAGLAYRWDATVSALVGFQVSSSWTIGYAYDHETTRFATYNSGSHEVFLRYELSSKENRIISPRFF